MSIRERREALNPPLSQSDLAAKLGISPGHLSTIESGRQFPGPHLLYELREITGLTADEILDAWATESGKKPTPSTGASHGNESSKAQDRQGKAREKRRRA